MSMYCHSERKRALWDVGHGVRRPVCDSFLCHVGMREQSCEVRTKGQRLDVEVKASRCQNVLELPKYRSFSLAL